MSVPSNVIAGNQVVISEADRVQTAWKSLESSPPKLSRTGKPRGSNFEQMQRQDARVSSLFGRGMTAEERQNSYLTHQALSGWLQMSPMHYMG